MKKFAAIFCVLCLAFTTCVTNPFTGQSTMAFVDNSQLFPSAFAQYDEFLSENTVITGTQEAEMVSRVGNRIRQAAERWLASEGQYQYLNGYAWEYNLIQSDEVNAWCMPGGKIVVYTGILPITLNEDGLAVVMGHEIAHALLNHGQQRMSADVLQQLGAVGLSVISDSELLMAAYGIGSTLGGTLPFSRTHESEADHYGLQLMAIAGYNPEESVPFWQRMSQMGGVTPEFLSTHPSDTTRIRNLQGWIPEAREKAAALR
jgi:predicted Zn-dependent protease